MPDILLFIGHEIIVPTQLHEWVYNQILCTEIEVKQGIGCALRRRGLFGVLCRGISSFLYRYIPLH